jgi:hypothetical protein
MKKITKYLVKVISNTVLSLLICNTVFADSIYNLNESVEINALPLPGNLLSSSKFSNTGLYLNKSFVRFGPNLPSNSGHTVFEECGDSFDGNDYDGQQPATAKLMSVQIGTHTWVYVTVKNARPSTLYTVWLRVKGTDRDGNSFGGSPLTNGGATPLAAGSALDELESLSPWNSPGSTELVNGFTTNSMGYGNLSVNLDFPLREGRYPFNEISSDALENIRTLKNPSAKAIPVAIVNPSDANIDAPFGIRIVSHCQDGLGHGLSPANRETWFDWPQ